MKPTRKSPTSVADESPLAGLKADLAAIEKSHSATKRKSAKIPEVERSPAPARKSKEQPGIALAVLESRHPVTVTFERTIQQGLASSELQAQWKADLSQMVIEGAKKFFGFHNVNALRKALDVNLALLSLALLIRTEGRPEIETWSDAVLNTPLTDLLNESLGHIKGLAYGQEYLFPEMEERPLREVLLEIARARDARHKEMWTGYERFLQEQRNRRAQQTTDKLARFLIECLLRKNPKVWLKSTATGSGANLEDVGSFVTAEEAINTLILRYCLLNPGERIPENIDLNSEYILGMRKDYEASPKAWLAAANTRFEQLLKLLSPPLRERLTEPKNWFETRLKNGPPKPTAKSLRKKERAPDDDEEPDLADIPGISGIYCYQIYG